jgi:glycosyltransferase involved in cell wall biosynthesis
MPFWSVMVPTYNCARFLGETLRSVLAQDPGPEQMQIAVVDDHSTADDPQAVVREVAGERVEFYRNPRSLGAPGNFNQCIAHARGQWIHILHGDDAVRPGFYQRLACAIRENPGLVAAFCRAIFIDEEGRWIGISDLDLPRAQVYPELFQTLLVSNRIWTPSIVVRRAVYEAVGGFRPELPHCCDWDMWKRVAKAGPVWFDPEPLALYRKHAAQDSASLEKSARNIADMRQAIAVSAAYIAPEQNGLLEKAKAKVAEIALVSAREFLERGNFRAAWRQLLEGFRTAPRFSTAGNATVTVLAYLLRRLLRPPHRS